jgi:hypothetical protein
VRVLLADAEGFPGDALDLAFEAGTGPGRLARLLETSVTAIPYAARIALRAGRRANAVTWRRTLTGWRRRTRGWS